MVFYDISCPVLVIALKINIKSVSFTKKEIIKSKFQLARRSVLKKIIPGILYRADE
jgi:hypothetical protein